MSSNRVAALCKRLTVVVAAGVLVGSGHSEALAQRANDAPDVRTLYPILGDVNRDCLVNVVDLNHVLAGFGGSAEHLDLSGDGVVDDVDLELLLVVWGSTCGSCSVRAVPSRSTR